VAKNQDEINDSEDQEDKPTASFDSSICGPGTQIGCFQIEREIGRGAMGIVYLAHDSKLNRKVAIKSLPPDLIKNEKLRSRFKHEARALASINHPNIATIYEVFDEDPQHHFLILEYIPGKTLAELVSKKTLKLKEALNMANQIAEAVAAAHEQGVIHRDLKPGNIKITPDGKVKVLDFGLAKAVAGRALDEKSTLTLPGRIIGTPAYMSPEQARGREVDKRTDIWSFGCCLFEMLTAGLPFRGETMSDIIAAVLNHEPDWSLLPPQTPPEVVTLLRRCLEKESRRRLRAIGDIAITLEETIHTDHMAWTSPQPTTVPKARQAWVSRFWPIAAGLLLALIAVGIVFWRPGTATVAPEQIGSLAVLPFEASDSDPNLADYAQWIPDDISGVLQRLDIFDRVPAWSFVKTFANALPREAAKELKVQGLVQGRIRYDGDQLNVNLELIDGQTSDQIRSWTFKTVDNDIEGLKRRIVESLVQEGLKRELDVDEQARLGPARKVDSRAYAAYRRGLEWFFNFGEKENLDKAVREFETARRLDSGFIDPLVMLADAAWSTTLGKSHIRPREAFPQAKKCLQEAIDLAPDSAAVLWEQGFLAMAGDWDWKRAQECFHKAVSTSPENATYYEGLMQYAWRVEGRYSDAIDYINRGLQLDPNNPGLISNEPWVHACYGHYEKAINLHKRYRQDKSKEWGHLNGIAQCLSGLGRPDEALDIARQATDLSERDPTILVCLASILAQSGNEVEARSILLEVEEKAKDYYVPAIYLAEAYAGLGEWDSTFTWLERGYAEGAGMQLTDLRRHRLLTLMEDQPRYWDIVDRMKFPALPIEHEFYEIEQQMRFGKGGPITVQSTAPATYTEVRLPESAPLALVDEVPMLGFASPTLALSPDGRNLVYVGQRENGSQLFHRDLTRFVEPQPIQGTEGAHYAFFSPNSAELGFLTSNRVKKVALIGGEVTTLCRARVAVYANWIDDTIYFADHEGNRLNRVSARRGDPVEVFNLQGRGLYWGIVSWVLPGGGAALVSADSTFSNSRDNAEIRVVPLQGTDTKTLSITGFDARYLASGHLVFGRSGGVWAAPFDSQRLELTGKAVPVLKGVAVESIFGNVHAAFADNGTVAFVPGHDLARGRLAWVDQQKNENFFDMPERVYGIFDVSSDDRRFAIEVADVKDYIWIWDANAGGRDLTTEGSLFSPVWGPDGTQLAMLSRLPGSDTAEILLHAVDKGTERKIPLPESLAYPESWPHPESIGVSIFGAVTQVGVLNPMLPQDPLRLLSRDTNSGPISVWGAALSPDAAWIAYGSNEGSGQFQVWIEQINGDTRQQVSTDGGAEPVWCRNTDELFYRQGKRFLASHVTLEPSLDIGPARVVFEVPDFVDTKGISFRVSSDGERLFYIRRSKRPTTDRINIVHNWFTELARLAPPDE